MTSRIVHHLVEELERESHSTARLLERVPSDKLDWRPHPRSMSLGELAWHIATMPRRIAGLIEKGNFDLAGARPAATRMSDDFTGQLRESVQEAKRVLENLDDEGAAAPFTMTRGEQVIRSIPKFGAVRSMMLNHTYHHRGQLTVYLRLLEIPVPPMYGTTADENPFAT